MSDEKMVYSFYDKSDMLYVDCKECKKGRYGRTGCICNAGYKIKKGNVGGCFNGELMDKYDKSK